MIFLSRGLEKKFAMFVNRFTVYFVSEEITTKYLVYAFLTPEILITPQINQID